ncbi:MAG: hypothetical protein ACPG6R_11880 [Aequoribacter sp.]|uniref:hypothetical protein n=1 Tax=Aequoribacter sp. TaxID=2847771 RepID=UPI003C5484DA
MDIAIDSLDKRSSCIGFVLPFMLLSPVPDGSLAIVADRQQIAYSYRGVAVTDGYVAEGISTGNPFEDRAANARAYANLPNASYDEALIGMCRRDLSDGNGTLNELLIAWLQLRLGSSATNLMDLKAEAADYLSVDGWDEISDLTAIGA